MEFKTKKIQKVKRHPPNTSVHSDRFDASRPQFRKISQKDVKVELDDRFKSVFSDNRFQVQIVDKYGRKQNIRHQERAREELKEFYAVNDAMRRQNDCVTSPVSSVQSENRTGCLANRSKGECAEDPATRIAYLTALSRGELECSSSSDEEGEKYFVPEDDCSIVRDDHSMQIESVTLGVLDPSFKALDDIPVEYTNVESPYLAVTNADWTHLRAVDIFAIVSSFVPLGTVRHVTVYPSNFGKERLHKEELFGPVDVWKSNSNGCNGTNNNAARDDESMENANDDDQSVIAFDCADEFDPEKLRLYEASRLRYFFAIVEFVSARYADIVYKEVDGMEFEHSSAALDLRIIRSDELPDIILDRNMRDEASALPSSYNPPEFVVCALQQSSVQCTWDIGDRNREALLTKYSLSGQTWETVAENEDLKKYLGSDQSSDDESFSVKKKSNKLRNILGLESDTDDDKSEIELKSECESADESVVDGEKNYSKQSSFIPGKLHNTHASDEPKTEPTPWGKYQEKRRQKRREKRAATREKKKQVNDARKGGFSSVEKSNDNFSEVHGEELSENSEIALNYPIVAGINDDEERDFDIRGLERIEKNKTKQLKGSRKRREDRFAASAAGMDFQVNTHDERFRIVLEGIDERFGIDRTDPNFKETPAMRQILDAQTQYRKKQRKPDKEESSEASVDVLIGVDKGILPPKSNSAALSALITSIKANVKV